MRTCLRAAFLAVFVLAFPLHAAVAADSTAAKLTIREAGGSLSWLEFPTSTLFLVKVAGAPWGEHNTAELVDSSGEHTVVVNGLDPQSDCVGAPELRTGLGDSSWCLKLTGMDGGHEYTGTITPVADATDPDAERTALTLTLTTRDGFAGWPLVVVVVAGALGVWWSFWVSGKLGKTVSANLLLDAVERNRGPDGTPIVVKLTNWLDEAHARSNKKTDEELRKIVLTAIEVDGPRVRADKAALNNAVSAFLSKHPGWENVPLIAAARSVGASETNMAELYSTDGTKQAATAAEESSARLEKAEAFLGRLQSAADEIDSAPNSPDRRRELHAQALAVAKALREQARTDEDLGFISQRILQLLDDIYPGDANRQAVEMDLGAAGALNPVVLREMVPAARARSAIILTVLGFAVIAVITAASGTYAPNQTFGSSWDYSALAISAFGSASIAGITTALALGAVERSKG